MVESVELVVAALVAGAAVGAGDTASVAVRDAYQGLKSLTLRALRRRESVPDGAVEDVVEADSGDAGHEKELVSALREVGAGEDGELVAAARRVLELVDPDGAARGKYRVVVLDNKGVQVGDHNTQTNTFT